VLSHKTYQNQGICYVTETLVARNKFPHVKVAHNTKKVGQAWSMVCKSISSKNIQSDMNYIATNTSFQLATQAVTDEQRNFATAAVLLVTSILWFSLIASILADS